MKCEEALIAISAALDGEAGQEELQGLEAHLEQCPECRAIAEDLGLISAALSEQAELPADFAGRMEQALKAADTRKKKAYSWSRYGSLAAMLAVVLCLGGLFAIGGGNFVPKNDAATERNVSTVTSAAGILTGDYSVVADSAYDVRDVGGEDGIVAYSYAGSAQENKTEWKGESAPNAAQSAAPIESQEKETVQYDPPDHATIYTGLKLVFEYMGGFDAYPGLNDKDYYFFVLESTDNENTGAKSELRLEYTGLSENGKYLTYSLKVYGQDKEVAHVTNMNNYAVSIETHEVLQEYAENRSDADHVKAYRQVITE